MIALTYAMAALSLAYILDKRIVTASIFALVPTFDSALNLIPPFVEHGIMHSFLAAIIAAFLVYTYSEDRESAESCLLGYTTHLMLDLVSEPEIPLFYPFFNEFSLGFIPSHSLWWNLAIISVSVCGMFVKKNPEIFQPFLNPE